MMTTEEWNDKPRGKEYGAEPEFDANGWCHDMSAAPRDGTPLLLYSARADLIDMGVLQRVEAGYTKALATAESWIHDQLDGTGQVEAALADLDESRAALADLRAMMEKLK